ncbi:BQ2448_7322 [Microbotryum intermedium]|uniref:BQ2448_7322 protein n=1 Tax=Microbotryum intermedium TaxID=269621 RepID=A0A238FQM3_9BASI|nr:BQ2448_7322 [Microbotryum intermedium]
MQGALLSGMTEKPQQRAFNPYSVRALVWHKTTNSREMTIDADDARTDNGGTILAISSKDFAIVASDTRQSEGYNIQSRTARRCYPLTDQVVIATVGFQADASHLVKRIQQRLEVSVGGGENGTALEDPTCADTVAFAQWYYHTHGEKPSLPSIARLVQTMLYGKRFFPYYAWVILGGIDRDGTGAVYSFDPVGSYERESCRAAGAAQSLVQPFLDNLVYGKNQVHDPALPPLAKGERPAQPLETVLALVTDALTGAAEREIAVGDGLDLFTIVKGEGIKYRHIRKLYRVLLAETGSDADFAGDDSC